MPDLIHTLTPEQLAALREELSNWFAVPGIDDLTGEMFEFSFANAVNGVRKPGRPNRPTADVIIDGVNYSCKTVKADGSPQAKLGQCHKFIEARRGLPEGLSLQSSPNVIGNALIEDYNNVCRTNNWQMTVHMLRFRQNREFAIWMEPWQPLVAADYRWENTQRARNGQLNLVAFDRQGAKALAWTSLGTQFYIQRLIPVHAQIFTIEHNKFSVVEWRQMMSQRNQIFNNG